MAQNYHLKNDKNHHRLRRGPASGHHLHNHHLMHDINTYIAEATREVAMRRQVYPGRVSGKKMSQAAADKKIELMRQIGVIFHIAETLRMHPQDLKLPIYEPDGSPYPISTLEPHIKEAEQEIGWREHMLTKSNLGAATKRIKAEQLAIMREMVQHLRAIQDKETSAKPLTQTSLFQ